MLRRVDGIQTDGRGTLVDLVRHGLDRDRVFLKPVVPANLEEFYRVRRAHPSARNGRPVRLLAVGRLVPQKDFVGLLEAFRILVKERGLDLRLRIVGRGGLKRALIGKTGRDGTGDFVEWVDEVERGAMPGCMAEADVLVLSSRYEGFARVLMEAAASGLPCVATRVSGVEELLGGIGDQVGSVLKASGHEAAGCGKPGWPVVPVGDPGALADGIEELCKNHLLRTALGSLLRGKVRSLPGSGEGELLQVEIWGRLATWNPAGMSGGVAGCRRVAPGRSVAAGAVEASGVPEGSGVAVGRLRRLLVFNLATDSEHPVLGFTTLWLRGLARCADHVDVITMWMGRVDLPENVRVLSVGRERGTGRLRRGVRFLGLLERVLSEGPVDGCFSHMSIEFSILAAPSLRLRGIPLVTWYAHPSLTPTLRLAHWVSDRIVTSFPRSYPISSEKVRIIGQGIDTRLFSPGAGEGEIQGRILCVGRISPAKNLSTLLRACAGLDGAWHLVLMGACEGESDLRCRAELEAEAERLGIRQRLEMHAPVSPAELPGLIRRCAVHVNLTPAGFGDKVALEAMACARPCLFANADFLDMLGGAGAPFYFEPGSVSGLREGLGRVLGWGERRRREEGVRLREVVVDGHSLPGLCRRVVGEILELRGEGGVPRNEG